MDELTKILLTSSLTVLGGVLVFVTGQLTVKFLIEPIHEFKKVIGETRFTLAFYAPVIHTPAARDKESSNKTAEALMKVSCDLLAQVDSIPLYVILSSRFPKFLPAKALVVDAATQLRGLSSHVHETGDHAMDHLDVIASRVARIEHDLGINPAGPGDLL